MHHSNILSLALFIASAQHGQARPQPQDGPTQAVIPCLTTVDMGLDIIIATPGPGSAVIEIGRVDLLNPETTSFTATSTLIPNAPAITAVGQRAISLNDQGNIVLDGIPYDLTGNPCPRQLKPFPSPIFTGAPVPSATSAPARRDEPEEQTDRLTQLVTPDTPIPDPRCVVIGQCVPGQIQ